MARHRRALILVRRRVLVVEQLEGRRVLASITATLIGSELQIVGTESSDQIHVGLSGTRIKIAGLDQTFSASQVQSIYITGLGGKDTINLSPDARGVGPVNIEATVDGGDGDDVIQAGERSATIHGGLGNDTIIGSRGADFLYGDEGNDSISGLGGDDFLDGGAGDDRINGHLGGDHITGGDGNDALFGNEGDDWIDGEVGNDFVSGGKNNDTVYGGDGQDHLDGAQDFDIVYGGLGRLRQRRLGGRHAAWPVGHGHPRRRRWGR
jgi:Ca2+-binding RTX toxin-like protein